MSPPPAAACYLVHLARQTSDLVISYISIILISLEIMEKKHGRKSCINTTDVGFPHNVVKCLGELRKPPAWALRLTRHQAQ